MFMFFKEWFLIHSDTQSMRCLRLKNHEFSRFILEDTERNALDLTEF